MPLAAASGGRPRDRAIPRTEPFTTLQDRGWNAMMLMSADKADKTVTADKSADRPSVQGSTVRTRGACEIANGGA